MQRVMRRVRDITMEIEGSVKPTLKNTSEHKGFCIALAAVNNWIGEVSIPDFNESGLLICPDCGVVMVKKQGTNRAGEEGVAWTCACEPTTTTDDQDGGD